MGRRTGMGLGPGSSKLWVELQSNKESSLGKIETILMKSFMKALMLY